MERWSSRRKDGREWSKKKKDDVTCISLLLIKTLVCRNGVTQGEKRKMPPDVKKKHEYETEGEREEEGRGRESFAHKY